MRSLVYTAEHSHESCMRAAAKAICRDCKELMPHFEFPPGIELPQLLHCLRKVDLVGIAVSLLKGNTLQMVLILIKE